MLALFCVLTLLCLRALLYMLTLLGVCDVGLLDLWSQSMLLLHQWDLVDRLPELRQHDYDRDHNTNPVDLQHACHPGSTNISS